MLHRKRKSDRFHGNRNFTTSQKIRYNAVIMIHVARRGIGVWKRECTSRRGSKAPPSASTHCPKHTLIPQQWAGGGDGRRKCCHFILLTTGSAESLLAERAAKLFLPIRLLTKGWVYVLFDPLGNLHPCGDSAPPCYIEHCQSCRNFC